MVLRDMMKLSPASLAVDSSRPKQTPLAQAYQAWVRSFDVSDSTIRLASFCQFCSFYLFSAREKEDELRQFKAPRKSLSETVLGFFALLCLMSFDKSSDTAESHVDGRVIVSRFHQLSQHIFTELDDAPVSGWLKFELSSSEQRWLEEKIRDLGFASRCPLEAEGLLYLLSAMVKVYGDFFVGDCKTHLIMRIKTLLFSSLHVYQNYQLSSRQRYRLPTSRYAEPALLTKVLSWLMEEIPLSKVEDKFISGTSNTIYPSSLWGDKPCFGYIIGNYLYPVMLQEASATEICVALRVEKESYDDRFYSNENSHLYVRMIRELQAVKCEYVALPLNLVDTYTRIELLNMADTDLYSYIFSQRIIDVNHGFNSRSHSILLDILAALTHLHLTLNIVHADLSAANVLVYLSKGKHGQVHAKLTDLDRLKTIDSNYSSRHDFCTYEYAHPQSSYSSLPQHDLFSFSVIALRLYQWIGPIGTSDEDGLTYDVGRHAYEPPGCVTLSFAKNFYNQRSGDHAMLAIFCLLMKMQNLVYTGGFFPGGQPEVVTPDYLSTEKYYALFKQVCLDNNKNVVKKIHQTKDAAWV